MINRQHVSPVIPALNEEQAIGQVIKQLQRLQNAQQQRLIDDIVVCDNGSTDTTAQVATSLGARVVYQCERGYGIACQSAVNHLLATDIVLFIDGDNSCVVSQAMELIAAVSEQGQYDIAIGSRALGKAEAGALTTVQRFGNWLATIMIRYLWRCHITDLGPFRAIRYNALQKLDMEDRRFGWTVEMQVKAIQHHLNMVEIPVDSIRRVGQSKISGTVTGVIGAGIGIIGKIILLRWQ